MIGSRALPPARPTLLVDWAKAAPGERRRVNAEDCQTLVPFPSGNGGRCRPGLERATQDSDPRHCGGASRGAGDRWLAPERGRPCGLRRSRLGAAGPGGGCRSLGPRL